MKTVAFINSGSHSGFIKFFEAFKQGLEDFGYGDGENVEILPRWAEGKFKKLKDLLKDLEGIDVIAATGGVVVAQAAAAATPKIPTVFLGGFDPAQVEFAVGKKGPPTNLTGISVSTTESATQRLAELRKVFPGAKKVAVILRPDTFVFEREKEQAKKNGLEIFEAEDKAGLVTAIDDAKKASNALMVCADPSFNTWRKHIIHHVEKHPAIYPFRAYPEAGGLMSYGPSLRKAYRMVGEYVAKILQGAEPSDLPMVSVPISDFELVINGGTAAALGIALNPAQRKGAHVI